MGPSTARVGSVPWQGMEESQGAVGGWCLAEQSWGACKLAHSMSACLLGVQGKGWDASDVPGREATCVPSLPLCCSATASVSFRRTASHCSTPGAGVEKQCEICQGNRSHYFASDNNTTLF